jgi:hypothetical protein
VSTVTPANNLLSDVMKRPAFLPERVLARAKSGKSGGDLCAEGALGTFYSPVSQGASDGLIFLNFVPFDPTYLASYPYAPVPIPATAVGQIFLRSPSNASSGYVDLGEYNIAQVVYIPTGGVPSGDAMQIFFENLDDYWENTSYDLKIIIKAEPNGCILAQGEYLYP